MNEFDKAHHNMAKALSADLSRFKSDLESGESDRKAAVQAEIAAIQAETGETAAAWNEVLAKMQSVRGHGTITGPAKVKATVAAKPVEEAIGEPVGEEKEEEEVDLEDEILDTLEHNTDGLKMAEIADILSVENWQSLIPIMSELLDDGLVGKEGSRYYIL